MVLVGKEKSCEEFLYLKRKTYLSETVPVLGGNYLFWKSLFSIRYLIVF